MVGLLTRLAMIATFFLGLRGRLLLVASTARFPQSCLQKLLGRILVKQKHLWMMPSPFLLFLLLSDVLYKAASSVLKLHFCRFVLDRSVAFFPFAVLFYLLKFCPCFSSRIMHCFPSFFVSSSFAIHVVVQLQFFPY